MKNVKRIWTGVALAGVCGAAVMLAGCNVAGAAYLLAKGPEKIPAVYTLPKDRTAVIVIDDRANVVPQRSLREGIGASAEKEILARGLVKDLIASRNATAVMSRERYGSPMTIAEIGAAVKADLVIYVAMDKFTLSEDGQTLMPLATGRMKVVDVKTGQRMSPPEGRSVEFHPMSVRLPAQASNAPRTTTDQLGALSDLASLTGVAISQLFYDAEKTATEPNRLKEQR